MKSDHKDKWHELAEQIKSKLSCVEAARDILNLPINSEGDRCKSFLHDGKNDSSCVFYDDYWLSYSDNVSGDVISLIAYAMFLEGTVPNMGKAISWLATYLTIPLHNDFDEKKWKEQVNLLDTQIKVWHKELLKDDKVLEYLHKRHINDDTIKKMSIGYFKGHNRVIIPMYKNGYVCYYVGRTLKDELPERIIKYGKSWGAKYEKPWLEDERYNVAFSNELYGVDSLKDNDDTLVIAEGAFDFLSFYQEGFATLSIFGGRHSPKQKKLLVKYAKKFKRVMLTFDNDDSGTSFTYDIAGLLFANKIDFIFASIPESYKDISEYYCDGGDLGHLIDTARDGLPELVKSFKTDQELDDFMKQNARFIDKVRLARIFESVKETGKFPKDVLKAIKDNAVKPPNDKFICDIISNSKQLLYNKRLGFCEYNGKYWERIDDEQVTRYIMNELGTHATGNRVGSITKMLKGSVHINNPNMRFNATEVINFKNGTLDLVNGKGGMPYLRPFDRNDYVDYALPYTYDDSSSQDDFKAFIETVCDNDKQKELVLQEIAGYILYNSNKVMQTGFFLVGDGSNGKSVYLNMISKAIGERNVSNVDISSLNQPFQRIKLASSLINISSDASTKIEECDNVFKQITAGDTISACFKGKDYIDFEPRSKMFIACNELPKPRDLTSGWDRRMKIVQFNLQFVDNPTLPHERPINRSLEKTLSMNLSGVFNWILDGYLLLRSKGKFDLTGDEDEVKDSYRMSLNNVLRFANSYELSSSCRKGTDTFNDYREWCMEEGIKYGVKSRTEFYNLFSNAIAKKRPDIIKYKRGGTIYFKYDLSKHDERIKSLELDDMMSVN